MRVWVRNVPLDISSAAQFNLQEESFINS